MKMQQILTNNFRKYFSQLSREKKFIPRRLTKEVDYKKDKLLENKYYDGMDDRNTDDLITKSREVFYPKQHPVKLYNEDTNIISYKPPSMNLTEFNRVPPSISVFENQNFESPDNSRSLDIGIIGPTNAGKSSLINRLVGASISAVSSKYGTTNEKLEGIYTDINDRTQLVFFDTPGAIKASKSIKNRSIITKAWKILPECDKILFVVDAVKHLDMITKESIKRLLTQKFDPQTIRLWNKIKSRKEEELTIEDVVKMKNEANQPDSSDLMPRILSSVLVMNKVDLVINKRKMKNLQEELEDIGAFDKVFFTSCTSNYGIDSLINYLKGESQRRPWKFHPNIKTTQSDQVKCEETLRGLIYNRFFKEIPYDTMVTMKSWVPFNNGQIKINFQVEVRYEDQISMFVGEKARIVKELREELNKVLTIAYQIPVECNIFVIRRQKRLSCETLNQHNSLADL